MEILRFCSDMGGSYENFGPKLNQLTTEIDATSPANATAEYDYATILSPYIYQLMLSSIYNTAFSEAMQMFEKGVDRQEILSLLVSAAEQASGPDAVASILLLDEGGLLRNGASPKLPDDYLKAIDGIKPHPNVGTCAAAAATGQPVITLSFYADNKWAELRHLPTALGFVGAWSMPIKTNENKVLGTFGTYFRNQREPSAEEMKGVELLASVAAIVVTSTAKKLNANPLV